MNREREHEDPDAEGPEIGDAIAAAEGAWSESDVEQFDQDRRDAWATWNVEGAKEAG